MAKRFTDRNKWEKRWFRRLSVELKAFWVFLCDRCDNAGFWSEDMEQVEFYLGVSIDTKKALEVFNEGEQRIVLWNNKWVIVDFIEYQYGTLTEKCNPHKPIIALLEKYENKGYNKGIFTLEDKTIQDKEKDKDKTIQEDPLFDKFWNLYPKRNGKKLGKGVTQNKFNRLSSDNKALVLQAVENYAKSKQAKDGYAVDPKRFIGADKKWADWLEPEKKGDHGAKTKSKYDKVVK